MNQKPGCRMICFCTALLVGFLMAPRLVTAAGNADIATGSASTATFRPDPDLPNCSSAPVRGDPKNGPSTWLVRSDGDCVVPMHWHSHGEIVIVVSGTAEIDVRNHKRIK